jgi:hypothetical protein
MRNTNTTIIMNTRNTSITSMRKTITKNTRNMNTNTTIMMTNMIVSMIIAIIMNTNMTTITPIRRKRKRIYPLVRNKPWKMEIRIPWQHPLEETGTLEHGIISKCHGCKNGRIYYSIHALELTGLGLFQLRPEPGKPLKSLEFTILESSWSPFSPHPSEPHLTHFLLASTRENIVHILH